MGYQTVQVDGTFRGMESAAKWEKGRAITYAKHSKKYHYGKKTYRVFFLFGYVFNLFTFILRRIFFIDDPSIFSQDHALSNEV